MHVDNLSERTVLDHFLLTGQSSVPRLAEWCGVPPTTSLGIVRRLVTKGLIIRGPEAFGSRGRPVVTYRPRLPQSVLACQFEGTELSVLVTRDGEVQGRRDVEIHGIRHPEQAVEVVRQLSEAILAATGVSRDSLAGLSLVINAADVGGQCLVSSVLPWVNDSLEEILARGLGMNARIVRTPVRVLAEYQRRIDREPSPPSSIVEFNVADGVSAHAIAHGQSLRGHCSLAGELGHVIVQPDGPTCGCGRRGCLEAFASGTAICRQVIEGMDSAGAATSLDAGPFRDGPPRAAVEGLWRAWQSGDTYAHAVMDVVLDKLGWGLGLVLNLFDPELVAVRGYVLDGKPAWLEEVRRRAGRWTLHAARRDNRVEFAAARFEDEMRVAACDYHYPFDVL